MIKPLILDINSGNILLKNIILKFSKNVSIGNNDNNILNATHIFCLELVVIVSYAKC